MDLTHLSDEEIDYELALRFVVNLGPLTHRNKVLKLKDLITKEDALQNTIYHSSEHVMSSTTNIETCQKRIGELKQLVDEAIQMKDAFATAQLRSRLLHYSHRLDAINPLAPFASTKETLCSLVKVLIDEVDSALSRFGQRGDRSETVVTNLLPSGDKPNEECSKQTDLASGQTGIVNTDGAYARLGIPANPTEQLTITSPPPFVGQVNTQAQHTIRQDNLDTGTEATHSRHQINQINNNGISPLEGPSGNSPNQAQLQHDGSFRGDGVPHSSASNSPPGYFSGRGIAVRSILNIRSDVEGRGRTTHVPSRSVDDSLHDNYNDLTYRNIITNNASLYADLLDRLARRIPTMQVQPPMDRAEDRRMTKAIHNWPFKFRGEKDTTSLNIFLDRVETFARSEGVSDGTLLSSIKHLLQEDALDWYSRAMSQRLLYSWDTFKKEIRREYLPTGYAQILRLEASFRYQGQNESFAKYFRDIAALFRFISPPLTEEEQFFIVKKNMNADYAAIVTAARPANLQEMVEVCTSYDETRMLLNRQRRLPVPHNALLEPNFATPVSQAKPYQSQPPRFPRVNAVEACNRIEDPLSTQQMSFPEGMPTPDEEEGEWQARMDQLLQQVNVLKGQFDRRLSKPSKGISNSQERTGLPQQAAASQSLSPNHTSQYQQRWQPGQQQRTWHQDRTADQQSESIQASQRQQSVLQNQPARHPAEQVLDQQQLPWHQTHQQSAWQQHQSAIQQNPPCTFQAKYAQPAGISGRSTTTCWNCDEEGHRFMDCPKPQAVLFCYRCGRKGYSLRSCFTCRTDAGNQQAENLL